MSHPNFLASVKVHACKVGPGDMLSVPWGWVLCESVVNNETNVGLRFADFNGSGTEAIRALFDIVAPKPEDVKPCTSIGLLKKLLDKLHMKGADHPSKGAGKADASKEEVKPEKVAGSGSAVGSSAPPIRETAAAKRKREATAAKTEKVETAAKAELAVAAEKKLRVS